MSYDGQYCCEKQPTDDGMDPSGTFEAQLNRNYPANPCVSPSNEPRRAIEGLCVLSQKFPFQTDRFQGATPSQTYLPSIEATQAISRMRGGAQSQLMLCDDGNLWVLKFKNNPQHIRILANELLATRMAETIGLSVPVTGVVQVSERLIEASPQLCIDKGPRGREMCSSGLQFGSRFVGGLMPRQVMDYLPDEQLSAVHNLDQFAGILAFDKWTGNNDGRQAVYCRTEQARDYGPVFIDQGFCFNAGEWTFQDAPLKGVFARNIAYSAVTGWDSFEPWLNRIEQFSRESLWEIAETVPPEWYGGDLRMMDALLETLLRRRSRVQELIDQFRLSDRVPFPCWQAISTTTLSQLADPDELATGEVEPEPYFDKKPSLCSSRSRLTSYKYVNRHLEVPIARLMTAEQRASAAYQFLGKHF